MATQLAGCVCILEKRLCRLRAVRKPQLFNPGRLAPASRHALWPQHFYCKWARDMFPVTRLCPRISAKMHSCDSQVVLQSASGFAKVFKFLFLVTQAHVGSILGLSSHGRPGLVWMSHQAGRPWLAGIGGLLSQAKC